MRILPHPRRTEGTVVLGVPRAVVGPGVPSAVGVLAVPSAVLGRVWAPVPAAERAGVAAAALAGVCVVFFLVMVVRSGRHRRVRTSRRQAAAPVETSWFSAHTLDGFPEEAVRARLGAPGAPPVERLYTAWILANHGMDAVGLERRLSLPADLAHLIVDAARSKR
ncbi:hypothetical protein [Streptomyces sp. TP-A0356]|uniref:hypothetical protein n=1 Tax=Streptomyces sp. TP-A0356 TaxID=1359208 RepID=UPI0006E120CD|nr:hypothetical protein [Streptomyces sp. TP-A0356]